jgi:hypothetical protein
MEKERVKQRRMGIDHKGIQGLAQRAVVLQEEEEEMKSFRGLEACSLMTATITALYCMCNYVVYGSPII